MLKSLSISLLLTLVLTGCVFDDLSNCQHTNISFFYSADGEKNVIHDYIDQATLFVYDKEGHLLYSEPVEKLALSFGKTMPLNLSPGKYTVVCWGNVKGNSKITSEENLKQARIQAPAYLDKEKIQSNDMLYFASQEIEVFGNNKEKTYNIKFKSAHIKFEVYVRNLKLADGAVPQLIISNLMPQYDFEMKSTQKFDYTYHPQMNATMKDGEKIFEGKTNVLRFSATNPVEVQLLYPDGTKLLVDEKLSLEKILQLAKEANLPIDLSKEELTVPIVIDFNKDGVINPGVSIQIMPWKNVFVVPTVHKD